MVTGKQKKSRPDVGASGGKRRDNTTGRGVYRHVHDDTPSTDCQPLHGKVVGRVWRKRVRCSTGMLHKPTGWAVDVFDLKRAEKLGALRLDLHETEQDVIYSAPLATLRQYGRPIDRGCGKQILLMLGYWATRDLDDPAPDPTPAHQLGFGGAL